MAILRGRVCSISSARDATPRVSSMLCCCAASGPIWRRMKASGCSSSRRLGVWLMRSPLLQGRTIGQPDDDRPGRAAANGHFMEDNTSETGLITLGIQQLVQLADIGGLDAEEPGSAVGIFVDQLWGVGKGLVDRYYFTADRRVDIRSGLDRLDHCALLARRELAPDFRQFDEHHVAKRILGMVGNAHGDGAIRFLAAPFLAAGVAQFAGGIAHFHGPRWVIRISVCRYGQSLDGSHARPAAGRGCRPWRCCRWLPARGPGRWNSRGWGKSCRW